MSVVSAALCCCTRRVAASRNLFSVATTLDLCSAAPIVVPRGGCSRRRRRGEIEFDARSARRIGIGAWRRRTVLGDDLGFVYVGCFVERGGGGGWLGLELKAFIGHVT